MHTKRISALVLLMLCFLFFFTAISINAAAVTGEGWTVMQAYLSDRFDWGMTENIAFGCVGAFWSAVAGPAGFLVGV